MAGMFIDVEVDAKVAADQALAKKLTEVCPVNIFAQEKDGRLRIVEENLDECVLCELCITAAPQGTVRVRKLYEDGAAASDARRNAPCRFQADIFARRSPRQTSHFTAAGYGERIRNARPSARGSHEVN
jgi:NAD-dependent dihydropyrimidine dehydrogenase PreA subunit